MGCAVKVQNVKHRLLQTCLSASKMVSTLFSLAAMTNGKPNLLLYLEENQLLIIIGSTAYLKDQISLDLMLGTIHSHYVGVREDTKQQTAVHNRSKVGYMLEIVNLGELL